jgi:hypothetical protein
MDAPVDPEQEIAAAIGREKFAATLFLRHDQLPLGELDPATTLSWIKRNRPVRNGTNVGRRR